MRDAYEIERAAYAIADTTARYAASTAAIRCSAITNSLFFPWEFDAQTAEFCGFLTETGLAEGVEKLQIPCRFQQNRENQGSGERFAADCILHQPVFKFASKRVDEAVSGPLRTFAGRRA